MAEPARTRMAALLVAAATLSTVAALVPASAQAAPTSTPNQAWWDGPQLHYSGGIGKSNAVVVTALGSTAYLIDDVSTIVPGSGCAHPGTDLTVVRCVEPDPDGLAWLIVHLNGHDDTFDMHASFNSYTYVYGGSGDDTIRLWSGTTHYNDLDGGSGNDTLLQVSGTAYVTMAGAAGADYMCGGASAFVDYGDHTQAVTASLDGVVGNDGTSGEGDTLCASLAGLSGSAYGDWLISSPTGATLNGRAGGDVLVGAAGPDKLYAGEGSDHLYGAAGDDRLDGGPGADQLNGGAGTDYCRDEAGDVYTGCETS